MNVFEYAMQMELDGKTYYEESVEKVDSPELKKILIELAGDEQKHYNIFKAMRDNEPVEYEESTQTKILSEVKNIFKVMKEENKDYTFPPDAKGIWEHAREVEKKAEDFYRKSAEELDDPKKAEILHKIADEEHKHWLTMDNIISFIDRPSNWLEDAEWSNLEDY
jgi:rubrerythrin